LGLEAVPVWCRAMKHQDVHVRRLATQPFGGVDSLFLRSAAAVPSLLAAVGDPGETVRNNARGGLGFLGQGPAGGEGALEVPVTPKAAHRARAADFLGEGQEPDAKLVPRLRRLVNDPDPAVRAAVGRTLQKLEQKANDPK